MNSELPLPLVQPASPGKSREPEPGEEAVDPGAVVSLVSQILAVNEQLQQRLEAAEAALQTRAKEVAAFQCEARTDTLTGLPNRRAFNDELNRCLEEFRGYGVLFSVILLDVDRFKGINDKYGHLAGDALLVDLARTLRAAIRQGDLAARFGGEEFVLLLPHTDAFGGRQTAERVRRGIEATPFVFESVSIAMTASCGVAQVLPGDNASELLKRSDNALYAAKRGGRNCTFWHTGERLDRVDGNLDDENRLTAADGGLQLSMLDQVCQDLRRRLLEVIRLERQAGE